MNELLRPIEIQRPPVIEFGPGVAAAAGRWAAAQGFRRPLVVADAFNAQRVAVLGLEGEVDVFGEVEPEPSVPNLEQLLALAERVRPDVVVGFGGGSAMDLAKLAAVLPGSGQGIADVVGPERVKGGPARWSRSRPPRAPAARPGRAPWSPIRRPTTSSRCRAGTCWPTSRPWTPS